MNISCPSGIVRWEDLDCEINRVEHEFMQGFAFLQINAKESNPFLGGESVKVCVMKAVGIFFFPSP